MENYRRFLFFISSETENATLLFWLQWQTICTVVKSRSSVNMLWLIRSLVDPTLTAFIVCGLLPFLVFDRETKM